LKLFTTDFHIVLTYIGDLYIGLRGQNTHFLNVMGSKSHKTPQN